MAVNNNKPYFSVIIPTRNRPELFKLALDSVINQMFSDVEIIVVNDGSDDEHLMKYKSIEQQSNQNIKFFHLVHRQNGHGQSYSMNFGVSKASGEYVCFLDDDDYWIDNDHLHRAYKSIANNSRQVDAYYTNQKAYFSDGTEQTDNVWIEDLKAKLSDNSFDSEGSYAVDIPFLLLSRGFAHLNCSIIRKTLYQQIGGMDENIRYECDRDIYIRSIDAAECILYSPANISRHNIPDQQKKDNMSTLVPFSEKLLYQLRVYDKGVALSKNIQLVDYCARGKMYILKKLAEGFYEKGEFKRSAYFSRQALGVKFTLKWYLFSLYLSLLSLMAPMRLIP